MTEEVRFRKRSYTVLGAGAVGGYYGALLQRAGHSVHYIIGSGAEEVRCSGLSIRSKNGDFHLPNPAVYSPGDPVPATDVVLICLKTTKNRVLPDQLPELVSPNTTIVILQNGIGNEQDVAAFLPTNRILGGLCFICSNKVRPGEIQHLDYGRIALGRHTADSLSFSGPTMKEIAGDMECAGIPITIKSNLEQARWEKLVWNIPYNGYCTLMQSTTDRLMACRTFREVIRDLMVEVQTVAASQGSPIEDKFLEKMLTDTKNMAAYKPSMLLDFENQRPLEVEYIFGRPLNSALAAGCKAPLLSTLFAQLDWLDQSYCRLPSAQ